MTNTYQKNTRKTSTRPGLAVPDAVTIAMGEIADDLHEDLLAVGAGLQVMGSLMEADVAAVCGPRGRHDPERTAVRHGSERGSVTLGGRRTGVTRPRMRATSGGGEVPVPAYELFSSSEILGRMAMGTMLGGLSSRGYTVGLEPVGENVERAASATSKSAVSRRFVAMIETSLSELLTAPLGNLDLVALMIDGVHFGEYLCVVALGIGIDGTKHPLGLVEGSTENTTVVAFRPIVSDDDHRQPPNASRSDRSGSSRRQSQPIDECSTMDPISARSARHPISDSTTAVEEGAVIQ